MAQMVPLDGAPEGQQREKCEEQLVQYGSNTAVRKCPTSWTEGHGEDTIGATAGGHDGQHVAGHCSAAGNAEERGRSAPAPATGLENGPHGTATAWAVVEGQWVATHHYVDGVWQSPDGEPARFEELLVILRAQIAGVNAAMAASQQLLQSAASVALAELRAAQSAVTTETMTMVGTFGQLWQHSDRPAYFADLARARQADGAPLLAGEELQRTWELLGPLPAGEEQQRTWELLSACNWPRLAPLRLPPPWARNRRMHRALGRTYPSNDTGPCK